MGAYLSKWVLGEEACTGGDLFDSEGLFDHLRCCKIEVKSKLTISETDLIEYFTKGLAYRSSHQDGFFKISVLFFQEQPFRNFPEESICSFVEQTLLSHRTDTNFPRSLKLFLEHKNCPGDPLATNR